MSVAVQARRASVEPDAIRIPAIGAGGALFPIGKMKAHRDGVQHLAVSVFVFSGDRLLIQRRAAHKYHCALQWANTCCSHPNWGESLAAAAHRRLREELGIEVALESRAELDYRAPVTGGLVENERVRIFRGETDSAALALRPDPEEVSETRWMTIPALRSTIARMPGDFAPWFRIYLARWNELGL